MTMPKSKVELVASPLLNLPKMIFLPVTCRPQKFQMSKLAAAPEGCRAARQAAEPWISGLPTIVYRKAWFSGLLRLCAAGGSLQKYAERPTHIACQLFSSVDECENQLLEGGRPHTNVPSQSFDEGLDNLVVRHRPMCCGIFPSPVQRSVPRKSVKKKC